MSKTNAKVKVLSASELDKLPTPRLRAYVRRLHAVHDGPHWEPADARAEKRAGKLTKADSEWHDAYQLAVSRLKTRGTAARSAL